MQSHIKVNGVWKLAIPYMKISGAWKKPKEGWIKVDGVWKQWWKAETVFSYTGSLQTYVVPQGITSLDIDMAGASGGGGSNTVPGGGRAGHRVQATISVTPGQTLYIAVAGAGIGRFTCYPMPDTYTSRPGGWPGGGASGYPTWTYLPGCFIVGASGGGYSGIFTSNIMSQANALVIAGGGGGNGTGGAAYTNGQSGTTSAGGSRGGVGYPNNDATNGSALQGGSGDSNGYFPTFQAQPGAGGGGGYFGGGGGYSAENSSDFAGYGGDGSSWTKSGTTNIINTNNYQSGNGYVKLMI